MKWLLRILLLIVLIIAFSLLETYWNIMGDIKRKQTVASLRQIRLVCALYAETHEGKYPDGTTSNEAFRQLFITGLIDDENDFPSGEIKRKITDNNIGTPENGYLQALAPGECRLTYIRGLIAGKTDPAIPLLYMQTVHGDGEVWMLGYTEGGEKILQPTTNGAVLQEHNGQQVDIFSEAYLKEKYGIAPQDILKPEGPPRDVLALASARKWENRRFEAVILTVILLILFLQREMKALQRKRKPLQ